MYLTAFKTLFNRGCIFFVVADEEFDELCFEFGLELDEIVSKSLKKRLY